MFRKPINVEINTDDATVNHNVNLTWLTTVRATRIIETAGKTAIAVAAATIVMKTSSEIIIHIAKTNIK